MGLFYAHGFPGYTSRHSYLPRQHQRLHHSQPAEDPPLLPAVNGVLLHPLAAVVCAFLSLHVRRYVRLYLCVTLQIFYFGWPPWGRRRPSFSDQNTNLLPSVFVWYLGPKWVVPKVSVDSEGTEVRTDVPSKISLSHWTLVTLSDGFIPAGRFGVVRDLLEVGPRPFVRMMHRMRRVCIRAPRTYLLFAVWSRLPRADPVLERRWAVARRVEGKQKKRRKKRDTPENSKTLGLPRIEFPRRQTQCKVVYYTRQKWNIGCFAFFVRCDSFCTINRFFFSENFDYEISRLMLIVCRSWVQLLELSSSCI